jgi:hypothetical protein
VVEVTCYSLNTGSTATIEVSRFRDLEGYCLRSLEEGNVDFKIPGFELYTCEISTDRDGGSFQIYDRDRQILSCNLYVYGSGEEAFLWAAWKNFYFQCARDLGMATPANDPVKPERLPWLSTLVFPNPNLVDCSIWLPIFERGIVATSVSLLRDRAAG